MSAASNDMSPVAGTDTAVTYTSDPTDKPIPIWPEGVLAVIAGATLLLIGLRHRTWIQRKTQEVQSAVSEFQNQGGLTELQQVAQHATELFKAGKGS